MRIKVWFTLVRPFTLITPFMAVLFGVILQLAEYNSLNIFWKNFPIIIFASFTLSAAQAVGQIMNQIEDIEIDRINKKDYRPIARGEISIEKAQLLALFLSIFSIIGGFSINIYYGFFMVSFLLAGILYNIEPFRLKKRLWLNTSLLAISRGLLPLPAAWCIFGNVTDKTPWLLGSVMAIWVLAWQNTKDLNDLEGDKKYGIVTPAIYHGFQKLSFIIAILSFISFLLLAIYLKAGWLSINMAALFLLAIPTIWMLYKLFKLDFSMITLENNELWAAFYLTLAGFYIIASFTYLIEPYIRLFK